MRPLWRAHRGPGHVSQCVAGPAVGCPGRDLGRSDPQVVRGNLLPRLVVGAAPAGRAGADDGACDLFPVWGQYAPDGEARRDVGHHPTVQVPGVGDAKELDEHVADFRSRPLGAGPYTFVAADAPVLKVREGGRVVNVHALVATGVNADGYR